jgi:hypothetical protein
LNGLFRCHGGSGSPWSISALRKEQSLEERGIDHAPEPDLAIDRHNRHLGIELQNKIGIAIDIHLGKRESKTALSVLKHIEGLVAATALRAAVDRESQVVGPRMPSQQSSQQ